MEKDFEDREAIKKLKSLAEDIRFCMYTTYSDGKIESRPMTTLEIDTDGNVWFFTSRNTEIGDETNRREPVTLIYSDPKSNTYISVSGNAAIVESEARKEELWNPMSKAWFPEGKDDPNLVVLKVTTDEAAYWDSTSSKMVVFFSMIKAVLTGTTPEGGDHGKLNLVG
ncbi:pyridoxamine 5'-phosphate oxidase family protein [Dyadobacter pollutisoli]|jgi:general stress protein 26|uniref:Pyridoxamine 5'-phosphate oxidase family protein n=1 Tax=Dyadobacter pollutisoli TaxID=2910158 RepID=A0A9E8N8L8_9BACT|nr:pyridoxamine 5'-phosphate oxidase family protein [Dyadobacter pollutisoli]WAC09927.1 pyridoxamine 5'-phosphate oxidase family protein [Dyadobacter pollutisoli]